MAFSSSSSFNPTISFQSQNNQLGFSHSQAFSTQSFKISQPATTHQRSSAKLRSKNSTTAFFWNQSNNSPPESAKQILKIQELSVYELNERENSGSPLATGNRAHTKLLLQTATASFGSL